jgi:hypothetical protein
MSKLSFKRQLDAIDAFHFNHQGFVADISNPGQFLVQAEQAIEKVGMAPSKGRSRLANLFINDAAHAQDIKAARAAISCAIAIIRPLGYPTEDLGFKALNIDPRDAYFRMAELTEMELRAAWKGDEAKQRRLLACRTLGRPLPAIEEPVELPAAIPLRSPKISNPKSAEIVTLRIPKMATEITQSQVSIGERFKCATCMMGWGVAAPLVGTLYGISSGAGSTLNSKCGIILNILFKGLPAITLGVIGGAFGAAAGFAVLANAMIEGPCQLSRIVKKPQTQPGLMRLYFGS